MKKIIHEMLVGDTDKTIRDFDKEPVETYIRDGRWIIRKVSTYHYLLNWGLSFTPLCEYFTNLNKKDKDVAWEWLTDNYDVHVGEIFDTSKQESDLSRVLHGTFVSINGEEYLILQVDRGDARLFKFNKNYDTYIPEWKSQTEINEEIKMGLIDGKGIFI